MARGYSDGRGDVRARGARVLRPQRRAAGRRRPSASGASVPTTCRRSAATTRPRPAATPRRGGPRCSTPATAGSAGRRRTAGAGLDPRFEEIFAAIAAEYDVPDQSLFQVSRGMVSPAVLDHGTDELKERYLPGIHRGEVDLLPAAQRARGRVRPRRAADGRRARRRRVGRQRPEGVELVRPRGLRRPAPRPHRPDGAQAPGPDDVHAADGHAGRRGPPAAPDDRRGPLQRGVLRRRADPRRQPRRRARRWLAGRADDADERAPRRRRRRRVARQPGGAADRAGHGARTQRRPGRAPAAGRGLHVRPPAAVPAPARRGRRGGGQGAGARGLDRQADLQRQPAAHGIDRRQPHRPGRSRPTTATGARSPGPASCAARPGCASPAAPTRSSATRCPSAPWACPKSRSDRRAAPGRHRWPASASSSTAGRSPPPTPGGCSPTSGPTSSRSRARPATRCATSGRTSTVARAPSAAPPRPTSTAASGRSSSTRRPPTDGRRSTPCSPPPTS